LPATNVRSTWNRPLVALVSVVLAPAAWGLLSRKGLLDECNEAALMQISYEADSISKSCVVRVHTLFLREVAARRGEANPCCLPLAGRTSDEATEVVRSLGRPFPDTPGRRRVALLCSLMFLLGDELPERVVVGPGQDSFVNSGSCTPATTYVAPGGRAKYSMHRTGGRSGPCNLRGVEPAAADTSALMELGHRVKHPL